MLRRFSAASWVRIAFMNLLLVASLGVIMRYKIQYSLPWLDQKNLQHAHSHFAFGGWVSLCLMAFMVQMLAGGLPPSRLVLYQRLLAAQLVTAVGMLVSFALQGYALYSISFSTASIILSFWFTSVYWQDLNRISVRSAAPWFKAALFFGLISALGTLALVYMMASRHIPQKAYLASVYWYLHFQYNGWFFFGCMGLLAHYLEKHFVTAVVSKTVFNLFAWACIPAYGLSVLWLSLPWYIYMLVVAAAVGQVAGFGLLLQQAFRRPWSMVFNGSVTGKRIFQFVVVAFSIKLLLQLGSVIPSVSKLAFGFRPVVIAYLHLVLLAVTSTFLVAYAFWTGFLGTGRQLRLGIWVFITGILANELVLAVQGISSFSYTALPMANQALLWIAIWIWLGLVLLTTSAFFPENQRYD